MTFLSLEEMRLPAAEALTDASIQSPKKGESLRTNRTFIVFENVLVMSSGPLNWHIGIQHVGTIESHLVSAKPIFAKTLCRVFWGFS